MSKPSKPPRRGWSRRDVLGHAAATAATAMLIEQVRLAFPGGAHAAAATTPEVTKAILGYIALTDASPLIIAKEKGFFAKHGMPDVEVAKQASWGATRDNLVLGSESNGIDGAHILTPMPYLISTGKVTQNNVPMPMYILARLNYDCQGISVSNEYRDLKVQKDAAPLKTAFAAKKAAGKEVKVAMTFPGGTHDLWIRYWLAAGGIDPDKDVSTIVVPPAQMVANMKVGNMDAFCVGEPWNEQLVHQDIGYTALTTGEIWFRHPEKALGLRAALVDKYPKATMAIVMATMEAQHVVRPDGEQAGDGGDHRPAPMVQRADRRHHRPHQGRHQLRQRPQREGHQSLHEVLGATASPIRSRATISGSSPRTSAGASSRRRSTPRRWSTRSTARICGARRRKRWPFRRRRFRPRRRAARRRSSTARCSIPSIRPSYLASLAIKRVEV